MLTKTTFCSFCGHSFLINQSWPRTCIACKEISYQNPLPVAVILVPVREELLVIRRNIEPQKGALALPGGFIEVNESWQQACQRELFEETCISISLEEIRLFDVISSPGGYHLQIFGICDNKNKEDLHPHITEEVQEILYIRVPQELGFTTHTTAIKRFFQTI
ncbi:MAG: NUDIX domain-containing protein [Pseudomonadota bacterium]